MSKGQKLEPKLRFPEFRGAEGWTGEKLGSITQKVGSGITPTGGEKNYKQSGRPFVRSQNIGWGELLLDDVVFIDEKTHNSFISTQINVFDVFLNITGASIGRSAVADTRIEGGNVNQHVCIIRVKPDELSPYFLNQYLISHDGQKQIDSFQAGGNRQGLNFEQIRSFLIPLPAVFAEQQKIAECLSSVDELMAAQARKVAALKTHKKGLMQQLFPREGETQPRLRFPEFQNAGEWESKTLKNIAKITSGSTPLRSNPEFFSGGTIPWVKTTDLNNSFIVETEEKITPKARARVNPAGSILIAMYGGFNQIGRTGCLSFPAATNQAISVLALDRKVAIPAYVLAWLNAKIEDWKRIASSSRKDPNITGSDVAKFTIVLPELAEQQRIASCLSSLDALITAETQKIEALKTHKKGLMQQLFPIPETCHDD